MNAHAGRPVNRRHRSDLAICIAKVEQVDKKNPSKRTRVAKLAMYRMFIAVTQEPVAKLIAMAMSWFRRITIQIPVAVLETKKRSFQTKRS
jgi:hypothetical protein